MNRQQVYELIDGERDYQNWRWNATTTYSEGKHSPEEWFMYIEDYVNEAKHILSRENIQQAYPKAMDIMRKVAAMAVNAMEQNDTKPRPSKRRKFYRLKEEVKTVIEVDGEIVELVERLRNNEVMYCVIQDNRRRWAIPEVEFNEYFEFVKDTVEYAL